MTRTQVIGEGKTLEEAIENALNKMQVKRDQVDIEIIEKPSKRIFGLKVGTAKVRLTLRDKETSSPQLGVVSVVDGKLQYTQPPPEGIAPTIRFGNELHVLYHGEPVENQVILSDGLEPLEIILPENRDPELSYEVVVNPQKTKAQLIWKRTPGVVYKLADQPPTNHLVLSVTKTVVEARTLTLEDVRQIVQIEGLSYGLRLDELTADTFNSSQGLIDLAVGLEPRESRDPSIRYIFQEEAASIDMDAIRIDHYEAHGIEGVEKGAVLAIKDPGDPGSPGIDVYGRQIEPRPLRDVKLQVGPGAELSPDGLQAIATVSGLPSLHGGQIRVTKVFELAGDADVSTGNITMDGDIIVKGSVLENVKVESTKGTIVVNGLVSGATLRAGGSITVLRNVVRSQLNAGGFSVTQIRILNTLQRIADQLEGLVVAHESIVSQADNIPFQSLIKHLIELKFIELPKLIKELSSYIESSNGGAGDLTTLKAALDRCVPESGSLCITDIDELLLFRSVVQEQIAELESMGTTESNITVGYLQNARVEASGEVEVKGQGCFYSTVLAGTGFKIANGVFRGGEVTVNSGNIAAKELGGPTGIATKVQLLRNGRISANLVHPNVSIVIGVQAYKFDDTASQVKAYLHENILTVYSGPLKIHG